MTADTIPAGLQLLQQEVPASLIGHLPRVTCKGCKDNRCNEHRKQRCPKCGGYLTTAHIDLDYVGHAETTSKLLEADPAWSWEPLAFGDDGLPRFDDLGGLWIKLTVCGVTRLGYGTADNGGFKAKGDVRKEIIGDALRNAAMRFGWALNLWAKTDIHDRTPQEADEAPTVREPDPAKPRRAQRSKGAPDGDEWSTPKPPDRPSPGQMKALHALLTEKKGRLTDEQRHAGFSQFTGRAIASADDLTGKEVGALLDFLSRQPNFVSQEQQDDAALAEAQRLAATDPETDPERAEAHLRDALESAGSIEQLHTEWTGVEAAKTAGAIGAVAYGLLRQLATRREDVLKSGQGWSGPISRAMDEAAA